MANYKENLALWLMIMALLESKQYDKIEKIAAKMIKELESESD